MFIKKNLFKIFSRKQRKTVSARVFGIADVYCQVSLGKRRGEQELRSTRRRWTHVAVIEKRQFENRRDRTYFVIISTVVVGNEGR